MRLLLFLSMILFTGCKNNMQHALYDKALAGFTANYNAGNYQALFQSLSPLMQMAMPMEDAPAYFDGLKAQSGKILKTEFTGFEKDTIASYKTTFERDVFTIDLSVAKDSKITGLRIKPFVEGSRSAGKAVPDLEGIPKEITPAIIRHTKAFPNKGQVAIALLERGTVQFYGVQKEAAVLKPVNNKEAVFEIGSVTKVFTATLLAGAVVQGNLKLTDAINSHFDFPFKGNVALRFVELANHTAGLPRLPANLDLEKVDMQNPYKDYGKAQLETYLKSGLQLERKPGTQSEYSNLGAGLLGYTLGLIAKSTYKQLLQKVIFEKYHMTHTYTDATAVKKGLVRGINGDGSQTQNWDWDALSGAGCILSTVTDLAKFVEAQFDPANAALALTRVPTFTVNKEMKIGLGWHLLKSAAGKDLCWHNGATGGYTSSVAMNVEGKKAVVVLSNVTPDVTGDDMDALCFELLETLAKE